MVIDSAFMEKKHTNSGPLRESADKHSIYPSSAAPGHHLSHQSGDWLFPPLGLNLFLGSLRFQRPITRLCRASWPFLLILLVALALITYIPDLSLGLVRMLGYAEVPVLRR